MRNVRIQLVFKYSHVYIYIGQKVILALYYNTYILFVIRYHLRTYEDVFTGTEMVDWLLSKQIAISREDAVSYGDILLQGQVIEHVFQEHYFHDENYFYQIKPAL